MTALCLATLLALTAAGVPEGAATQPTLASTSGPVAPEAGSTATATAAPPRSATGPTVLPVSPADGPDVELHVPRAEVAKLSLDVENLQAKLDVDTSVARLVTIRAGVVATVQKLKAELEGVSAETHLVVRLNRVAEVLERALAAVDGNPQLAGDPVAAAPTGSAVPTSGVAIDAAAEPRPAAAPTKPPTE